MTKKLKPYMMIGGTYIKPTHQHTNKKVKCLSCGHLKNTPDNWCVYCGRYNAENKIAGRMQRLEIISN